ncbi:alkyl sulfatase dimerization domain-containing protein [uncultured Desulfovibrio sp.]|uniref:alkyl/aryl-sulfatase n=1 Tax=uncultured Desulfovibrio sp. TaxID=167968 RepID=UPI00258DBAB9|nr:alkyl sulfatase dimerization domain-containing protein [uncultured Desulfovibrio sp.]
MSLFHYVLLAAAGLACLFFDAGAAHAISQTASPGQMAEKPATAATRAVNEAVAGELDFNDRQDYEDAQRGFIAPLPDQGRIVDKSGRETWSLEKYAFLAPAMSRDMPPSRIMPTPAPDTVNPSLWRQSQLVLRDGLYQVTERIYQVRNADLSNMTIIEGDTGLIVADPLISAENAAAALHLYYEHRPRKPVKTVIYSHSHVDHYGGVLGVTTEKDVKSGAVQIIAPEGFLRAAMSENVMAGTAMGRRAQYMYGELLPPSPTGHVGAGLGLKNSSGATGLIPPTRTIARSGERLALDGLTFVFLLAPNTEAPAEMHWYIPELKALTAAENCTHTMHNLYTLRGAKTRDPLSWCRAINETLAQWGNEAEVLYSMHHWPVWGNARVRQTLALTSDLYRYINDQTLHLANQGQTMLEIAENLRLPPELNRIFGLRGYYGSLNHNVKAVYNFYLGWFDGNPAHLHSLPPREAARKYVEYMGGAGAVVQRARKDFEQGRYRWVAQVLNHVIFADPGNTEARALAADALEQLGYQAESGPWRNFYLSGARDLRGLPPARDKNAAQKSNSQSRAMTPDLYFDYLGVRLNAQRAEGHRLSLRVNVSDLEQIWNLRLGNSVLHARLSTDDPDAGIEPDVTLTADMPTVMALFEKRLPLDQAVKRGMIQGDRQALTELLGLLDSFTPDFPLVLPGKE